MPSLLKNKKYTALPVLVAPVFLSASVLLSPQAFAAPDANPNSYTTTIGQSITFNPLRNDRADIGTYIFLDEVNTPSPYGTGTVSKDGNDITYTPPAGFTGTTEFWYGIKDSVGLITSAPITITVSEDVTSVPYEKPQSSEDFAITTSGQTVVIDVLDNDTGDALTIVSVDNPKPYEPSGSAKKIREDNRDKISFTASANFVGESNFWYLIKDSKGNETASMITVTVNAATDTNPSRPVVNSDNAVTSVGTPIMISPLVNDLGANLKIIDVDRTTTKLNSAEIIGTDGILFTPSVASGVDSFWYAVEDENGFTDSTQIFVSVTGANSGSYPTAGADSFTVLKDSSDNIFNVFSNDTGSGLSFLELGYGSRESGRTIDNDMSVSYTPREGFVGTDDFWYSIKDSQGRTNAAKVTVTVVEPNGGANEAPLAVEDSLGSTTDAAEFEIDVLANDTDANGDTLKVVSVEPPRSGQVRLTADGRVLYTPPSFTTSDTFRYTVSDSRGGTDSVAVTIGVLDPENPTNNPVITNEFITLSAGESVVIRVLENDFDPDGDTLILDQVSGPSQGTVEKIADSNGDFNWVRYTALEGASGTDLFFYGVSDDLGGNGSGRVNITFE